jgi:hypothetical protein
MTVAVISVMMIAVPAVVLKKSAFTQHQSRNPGGRRFATLFAVGDLLRTSTRSLEKSTA